MMNATRFAEIYAEGLPRTIRFLRSMGYEMEAASEFAQIGWAKAWEKIDQLREERRILSWVNAIALNEGRREFRRARHDIQFSEWHEPRTGIDLAAIDVAKLLQRCEPDDRDLLKAQLEGTSYAEVAEHHGVSVTAARLRMFRARRSARDLAQNGDANAEDQVIQRLHRGFQASCLKLAHRHIEVATTFVHMARMDFHAPMRQDLIHRAQRAMDHALKTLSYLPKTNGEVQLARRSLDGLRENAKKLLRSAKKDQEAEPSAADRSVA